MNIVVLTSDNMGKQNGWLKRIVNYKPPQRFIYFFHKCNISYTFILLEYIFILIDFAP